jgi:heterodisulfide reductase subunit A
MTLFQTIFFYRNKHTPFLLKHASKREEITLSNNAVLVVGGGIAGMQASLDLANRGLTVYLVEKSPSIGGRMAQLDKTFPTMDCSICILAPKMIECFRHGNIKLLTCSEVKEVTGSVGNFKVKILKNPRFVHTDKCNGCGACTEKCPVKVPSEFEMGLGTRKAIYMPFPQAVPRTALIDNDHCLYFQKGVCRVCEKFCTVQAINFDQQPEEITLDVSSIILATGLKLYDPTSIREYGYKRHKNVLLSLEFERLINASGLTRGELLRPSDNKHPHRVVFIQCVGSRTQQKGFPYCSSVCCMYATKEAILIREHEPECEVYILYIDLRVFGKRFQEFVSRARDEWGVKYVNGRASLVVEEPGTKDLLVRYENTMEGKIEELRAGLVVLCPALIPREDNRLLARIFGLELNEYDFFKTRDPLLMSVETNVEGIFVCGYCQSPKDISESVTQASAAAARAAEVAVSAVVGR